MLELKGKWGPSVPDGVRVQMAQVFRSGAGAAVFLRQNAGAMGTLLSIGLGQQRDGLWLTRAP